MESTQNEALTVQLAPECSFTLSSPSTRETGNLRKNLIFPNINDLKFETHCRFLIKTRYR